MPQKHPNGNQTHNDAGCLVPAVPAWREEDWKVSDAHSPLCPASSAGEMALGWSENSYGQGRAGCCRTASDSAAGRVYSCMSKDRESTY